MLGVSPIPTWQCKGYYFMQKLKVRDPVQENLLSWELFFLLHISYKEEEFIHSYLTSCITSALDSVVVKVLNSKEGAI